ncbi:hypothetical protein [Algoriphagus resistens]|uniref:hypothetical protein n=1 Tax=Algoriphagus resistens TaxID=1750590 RepID=UPI000716AEC7|nr:hypothetical protein [Algoriphagus resistens]
MKFIQIKSKCVRELLFGAAIVLHTACSNSDDLPISQVGYSTGVVKNTAGIPLKQVRVLIDHSIFFNAGIHDLTDNEGKYRIKIPDGSWFAFAIHEVVYNGKTYSFYLHPDNTAGFGGEGAVRNFTWKLSGTMSPPLSGNYGGLITIDNYPGIYIEESEIDFILTPIGKLIDGSEGSPLIRNPTDTHIQDIPIGLYSLTATYQGKPVLLRKWNSEDAFVENYELHFEPQIEAQCDNCAKLEYYWEP